MSEMSLSIMIPTFNREKQLRNTLSRLAQNKGISGVLICVIDNNSDYNVSSIIKDFNERLNIKLVINKTNVGGSANVCKCFEYAETDWIWLLGDDDEPSENAIEFVLKDISQNKNENIFLYKYSNRESDFKDFEIAGAGALVNHLYNEKDRLDLSNLFFISTSVFNIGAIKKYISKAYLYTGSYVPHFIMSLFLMSENNKATVFFSNKKIVKYNAPESQFQSVTIGVGMALTGRSLFLNITDREENMLIEMLDTFFTSNYRSNFITLYQNSKSQQKYLSYKKKFLFLYWLNIKKYGLKDHLLFLILYCIFDKPRFIRVLAFLNKSFNKVLMNKEKDFYFKL